MINQHSLSHYKKQSSNWLLEDGYTGLAHGSSQEQSIFITHMGLSIHGVSPKTGGFPINNGYELRWSLGTTMAIDNPTETGVVCTSARQLLIFRVSHTGGPHPSSEPIAIHQQTQTRSTKYMKFLMLRLIINASYD